MTYDTIRFATLDGVARITLDRPERMNAATPQMFDEIADALDHLDAARALLITGAGRGFCAGTDLTALDANHAASGGQVAYRMLTRHYGPTLLKLVNLQIPVVAAVNGPAAGIGCSIALAGDFVLAAQSAYFVQAFVNIGLIADGGASWMLPRLVGKARATELMMLGDRVSAEKAVEWGMIYRCVEDGALLEQASALALRLARGPTVALGLMRQNIVSGLAGDFVASLAHEAEGQRIAGNSADAREGGVAFLEKRKPVFIGG